MGAWKLKIPSSFNINYSAMKRYQSAFIVTPMLIVASQNISYSNMWQGDLGLGIVDNFEHLVIIPFAFILSVVFV
jgi:hypothetical protein